MDQQTAAVPTDLPASSAGSELGRTSRVKEMLLESGVLGFLALLPALFFWRLFTANPLDLATIPVSDFTDIHLPYRMFLARSLASGDSLFWNPFAVAGHASLGDIQFQVFYPISLLTEWLAGTALNAQVLEAEIAAHLALAAIFTYLFARRLMPGRLGPLVAALAFTYGGYLTSFPIQQTIILQVSVWLPAILLLLELALANRRHECFVLAGIAAAVCVLAGHPQTVVYVAIGAGLYGLYRLWDTGFSLSQTIGLIAVPILAVGLSAVQLYPAYQHLQLTTRTDVSFAFTSSGFALSETLGMFFPSQLGGRQLYVGLLPLVAAGIALVNGRHSRARLFWGLLALAALLVSFGGHAFGQPALYAVLPILKFFRNHERTAFLFSFALAILAAYGVSDLSRIDRRQIRDIAKRALGMVSWGAVAMLVMAIVLLFANTLVPEASRSLFGELTDRAFLSVIILAGIIGTLGLAVRDGGSRRLVPILMVGLLIFDLFSTNWQNNIQPVKPADLYPQNQAVQLFQSDQGEPFRVASEGLLPGDGNAGSVYGFQDLVGNSPLELDSFYQFDQAVPEALRWQLLNVKYVVTQRQLDAGWLVPKAKMGDLNVYEISASQRLPRVYVVNSVLLATSPEDALHKTRGIDPILQAVIIGDPGLALPTSASTAAPAEATISSYRNAEIQVDINSSANGLLVFSEVYYPGWQAEVDGQPAPLLQTDYLLRGVPITAGTHHVRLTFSPSSLTVGSIISGTFALICLAALVAIFGRRRRQRLPSGAPNPRR